MANKHIGSSLGSLMNEVDTQETISKLRAWDPMGTIKPGHAHTPDDDRVFVFGSNILGLHGGGAAYYAHSKLGAEWGVGEGPTGRTYALPTCFEPGMPVDMMTLEVAVDCFLDYAHLSPAERFFVSEVGCGLAGFYACEVAPLFVDAPENCDLPPGWRTGKYACTCPRHDPVSP
jgi:hypothetical protein